MQKLQNKEILKKSLVFGLIIGAVLPVILFFILPFVGILALNDSGGQGTILILIIFGFLFLPFTFCTSIYKNLMEDICIPGNQPAYCPVECNLGVSLLSIFLVYFLIGTLITFLILKSKQRR